jgi:hypothetical protein
MDRNRIFEYVRVVRFSGGLIFWAITLPVSAWIAFTSQGWDMRAAFGFGALVSAWVVFIHIRWLWKGYPIRRPKGDPVSDPKWRAPSSSDSL